MTVIAPGMTVTRHELAPGADLGAYRYDLGNETWLLVTEGRPTVRHPDGEEELEPGDMVCFPPGPDGAHSVSNRTAAPVRVLRLATRHVPSVVVFPDSGIVELTAAGDVMRLRPALGADPAPS